MRKTDFVEKVFTEVTDEQVDAVLYQAMFDETIRLRRCMCKAERSSIRKFLTEAYQLFAGKRSPNVHQDTTRENELLLS